jgi:hypothetical protein
LLSKKRRAMPIPLIERELWVLEQLENRELTINELHERVPIHVCPGWEAEELGRRDPVTGLYGISEFSAQTIYQACERLLLRGKIDRRRERGRNGTQRPVWVYFRIAAPLEGEIASIAEALE